jgi:hypothetical protein
VDVASAVLKILECHPPSADETLTADEVPEADEMPEADETPGRMRRRDPARARRYDET